MHASYEGLGVEALVAGVLVVLLVTAFLCRRRRRCAPAVGLVRGFTDADGKHVTFTDGFGRKKHPVGQEVPVAYDPVGQGVQIAGGSRVAGPVLLGIGAALVVPGLLLIALGS